MFHHAEEYIQRGWSVIPLDGKKAAIKWKEYQNRRTTIGEATHWFGALGDFQGIGIVTGAVSDLVVIDCDNIDEAKWWWKQHQTPMLVRTAKGIHFYYRHPQQEIRNSVKLFDRAIDLRGDGGYVCAPPTIHPSGSEYAWITDDISMDEVPVFSPSWVPGVETVELRPLENAGDLIDRARRYVGKIVAISGKGGHNTTFRVACKLRDFGLGYSEAEELMLEWNRWNAKPEWTRDEIRHKLKDAFREEA